MKDWLVQKNGLRLDLFLKEAARVSRKQAKKLIDEGRLRLNGRKVIIASWELKKGDRLSLADENDITSLGEAAKNYFLQVVHEDEDLLVVEKTAGVPCEETKTSLKPPLPEIVYQYLKRAHPHLTHPFVLKLHRLDQPTSGLMVYGKSRKADPLLEDFKRHRIDRRYLALVEGRIQKDQGRIEVPLVKIPDAKGKKVRPGAKGEGKFSLTEYRVLQHYPAHTLVELNLKTGRTHQVRAHLAYLGHPVVGDSVYGEKGKKNGVLRLALHASELGFIHPVTKKKMKFHSKPPKEFQSLVERQLKRS
jgi:23S rRNA pseudouridine1911/1915/1917 synthase